MNNIFPKRYQDEINFIASHFYKICDDQRESISQLQLNTINDILENENLLLQDEDQLVRFLNSIYQPNSGFNYLYEHVNFTNLSNEVIKEFRSIFDKEEITEEIWQRILSRDSILISDRYLRNNIAYNNENPFAGIINYLKNIKNYNINIDSTPVYGNRDDCRPENVILFDDRTKFFHSIIKTNNGQDNWICFDFIDYKVIPNSYTIRSGRWVIGSGHPLNWKIEGSNDKETWEEIDNKNNCHELNRTHFVKNFQIENPKSHEFRYIRMKETGICADGSHYLAFDSFEIYGELIDHTKD